MSEDRPSVEELRDQFLSAVQRGEVEEARQLLNAQPKLVKCRGDESPGYGKPALTLAAQNVYSGAEMVRLLLKYGAPLNRRRLGGFGVTALEEAADYNNIEVVRLLLESGAEIQSNGQNWMGRSAFLIAVSRGYADVVKLLLAFDPTCVNDVSTQTRAFGSPLLGGHTGLWLACEKGHTAVVETLLLAGAETNVTGKDPRKDTKLPPVSPVAIARRRGHEDCASMVEAHARSYALHKARWLHDAGMSLRLAPQAEAPTYLARRLERCGGAGIASVEIKGPGLHRDRAASGVGAAEEARPVEEVACRRGVRRRVLEGAVMELKGDLFGMLMDIAGL